MSEWVSSTLVFVRDVDVSIGFYVRFLADMNVLSSSASIQSDPV